MPPWLGWRKSSCYDNPIVIQDHFKLTTIQVDSGARIFFLLKKKETL